MNDEIQAQGIMDIFKLLSKENIEKIDKILKAISIEELEDGVVKIGITVKF